MQTNTLFLKEMKRQQQRVETMQSEPLDGLSPLSPFVEIDIGSSRSSSADLYDSLLDKRSASAPNRSATSRRSRPKIVEMVDSTQ